MNPANAAGRINLIMKVGQVMSVEPFSFKMHIFNAYWRRVHYTKHTNICEEGESVSFLSRVKGLEVIVVMIRLSIFRFHLVHFVQEFMCQVVKLCCREKAMNRHCDERGAEIS